MTKHGLIKPHGGNKLLKLQKLMATTLGLLAVGISQSDTEVPDADELFFEGEITESR